MKLDFAPFSYKRPGYGLPSARLANMFPEDTPAGPSKMALFPRPGLEVAFSLGLAGVRGEFQQDGVFNGEGFVVAGTTLYRATVAIGEVALDTHTRFAASYTQLVIVSGGLAYCYDGTGLTQIAIPDGQLVVDVIIVGSRFYFLIAGSDVWYFSAIDDATSIDGLAFATADSAPDASIGAVVLGDMVLFFGRTTVETWYQTGDQDLPLARSQGATYTKGCVSIRAIVQADNRVFWVGNDLKVYTTGAPDRVSTHAIEQRLRQCEAPSQIHGFSVTWDGHELLFLNVPGQGTFVMHIESGTWSEWTSHGRPLFRCGVGIMVGSTAFLGDSETGKVFRLADVPTDDGEPIEFIGSCLAPAGMITSLELVGSVGVGSSRCPDPFVEMRYSPDGGQTWTAWRRHALGRIGDFDLRVRWTRLGLCRSPRPVEFRTTSPVRAVYSQVKVNEA